VTERGEVTAGVGVAKRGTADAERKTEERGARVRVPERETGEGRRADAR